jgi:hypothetical protein
MHEAKLGGIKKNYYDTLDHLAKDTSSSLTQGLPVTENILNAIIGMYSAAKVESIYEEKNRFESAYHAPITSEFEFYVARIMYHYSLMKKLEWHVFLRRQLNKTAPDVRIEIGNRTVAIIEIKARGGWIQPFLSRDRYEADKRKLHAKKSLYDPDDTIRKLKGQLSKYGDCFHVPRDAIFFLLPTLTLVHRTKYPSKIGNYYANFANTSGLPRGNLILLSENLKLDLSHPIITNMMPTDAFERMVRQVERNR